MDYHPASNYLYQVIPKSNIINWYHPSLLACCWGIQLPSMLSALLDILQVLFILLQTCLFSESCLILMTPMTMSAGNLLNMTQNACIVFIDIRMPLHWRNPSAQCTPLVLIPMLCPMSFVIILNSPSFAFVRMHLYQYTCHICSATKRFINEEFSSSLFLSISSTKWSKLFQK